MQAVDAQPWDPSVKALTQFPSVLDNLAKNLSWTSSLGEAYHTQAADVMTAVQVLRAKAKAAGNLKSGSQITVVQQSPQVIVIQPTNPQVVYVPQYNPTVVYGTPYVTPGYSTAAVVTTAVLAFGVGIAVGAAMSNSCCGGVTATGTATGTAAPSFTGATSTTETVHGTAATMDPTRCTAYNPQRGLTREAQPCDPYGSRSAGQAYNPSTGTYARGASASNALWHAGGRPGVQPKHGSLCRHASNLQRLWELRKLGCLQERQHRLHPASNYRERVGRIGTDFVGRQGCRRDGRVRQRVPRARPQMATSMRPQTAMSTRTPAAVGADPGTPKSTSSYSGANSAAANGYGGQEKSSGSSAFGGGGGSGWQSRAGECSRFGKPRWWWRLGRSQVKIAAERLRERCW